MDVPLAEDDTPIESPGDLPPTADPPIRLRDLFRIFLRSGFEFGSGIGVAAYLQQELVDKRHSITRSEFMTMFGLARLVPSGTVTALAVGLSYRYLGILGTFVALCGMILPSFVMTVGLTIPYTLLSGTQVLQVLNLTLVPAATAVLAVGAFKLGEEFFKPSIEGLLVVAATTAVLLGVDATVVIVAGGLIGAAAFRTTDPTA